MVPRLKRLARSIPDARGIADVLMKRGAKLHLGSTIHDQTDPMGKCSSTSWPRSPNLRVTSFACAPARCMAVAKAKRKLKGKKPRLSPI
jgi:hypothetical protein